MTDYRAPTRDISFTLQEVVDIERVRSLPGCEEFEPDTVNAVLEEAGRFASEVLGPLNRGGDTQGARWADGEVTTPDGFPDAYRQFVESGWNSLTGDPDWGGMGMPTLMGAAAHEMWNASNMSFALCPLLSASAIELLSHHGSDEQKTVYLTKMVSGEWPGTMDLTEPQAGSDLGALRSRAEPEGDHYRLFGQKIYITWGEHDAAENIVHLVLARLPDAPPGVKGISLFLVPKYLVNEDGSLGERNDMRCASIEHKLGIHGSPTCTMTYGEDGKGALGYLVGEPNRGLAHMFTMMNAARHKMGVQALGVADRAYQQALAYARDRVQGKPLDPEAPQGATIVHHPDVRRMLMGMKSQIEALRGLSYQSAADMDVARRHANEAERKRAQARVDLLIPVVKGWGTELGIELASTGIQVHGGMGFIEETGAAQQYRDIRIAAIYEGTNGIQAQDLVGRKLLRDRGEAMNDLLDEMQGERERLAGAGIEGLDTLTDGLGEALGDLRKATDSLLAVGADDPGAAMANAFNYMMLTGYVTGGWQLARVALAAKQALDGGTAETDFYRGKLAAARFYGAQVLPRAAGYARAVTAGAEAVLEPDPLAHF